MTTDNARTREARPLLLRLLASCLLAALLFLPGVLGAVPVWAEENTSPPEGVENPGDEEELVEDQPLNEIQSVVKIDWSDIPESEIPDFLNVVAIPDGNNIYAVSLQLSPENNWQHEYALPLGTNELNFNIPDTSFQFTVIPQGNTYTLKASKGQTDATDPYIYDINTGPAAEVANIAIPTANNDVPPNAELKIRIDRGKNPKETIGFVQEQSNRGLSEEEIQAQANAAVDPNGLNKWIYIGGAVAAAILALILVGLRLSMAAKNRRLRREEAEYYRDQEQRRRRR